MSRPLLGRHWALLLLALNLSLGAGCGEADDENDAGVSDGGATRDAANGADAAMAIDASSADAGATCTSTAVPPSRAGLTIAEPHSYETPAPSGPYSVGTHIAYVRDPSRLEVHSAAPNDQREIAFQI